MKKTITKTILALSLIANTLSPIMAAEQTTITTSQEENSEVQLQAVAELNLTWKSTAKNFKGSLNDERQIQIYEFLEENFSEYTNNTYTVSITPSSDIDFVRNCFAAATLAFQQDNPQLFWLKDSFGSELVKSGVSYTGIKIHIKSTNYNKTPSQLNTMKNKLEAQVTSVKNSLSKQNYKNNFDKVAFLHDYILSRTTYNKNAYSNGQANFEDYPDACSAYGPLIKGTGVCGGYSKAFQLLCKSVNIPCLCIESASHSWNYVYIGSKWYFVDTTRDDDNSYSYKYLCKKQPSNLSAVYGYLPCPNPSSSSYLKFGDADQNNRITASDSALVKDYVLGSYNLTPTQFIRADVDADGSLTMNDASQIMEKVLNGSYQLEAEK